MISASARARNKGGGGGGGGSHEQHLNGNAGTPFLGAKHESGRDRRPRRSLFLYALLCVGALLLCASWSFSMRRVLRSNSPEQEEAAAAGLTLDPSRLKNASALAGTAGGNASVARRRVPLFDPTHEKAVELVDDPKNECALEPPNWPPPSPRSSGYLLVRCNGGLNQMRAAICDMVAIARHINATMVIPELDKTSFWADPSDFGDVFDTRHFITSLAKEVKVIMRLPPKYRELADIYTMDPVSWSDMGYYSKVVLPLLKKHKVLRLNRTDSRIANNPPDVPVELQRLRCRVQYHALQFTRPIRALGQRIIARLRAKGPFIALHLRYEMDMLAFTGCTHGCSHVEERKLTKLRYRTARWREKQIDGAKQRRAGECPLTPEEVALMLRSMGYDRSTQIYIASGKIYGGKRRMARLLSIFPNTVRKEMLVTAEELAPFRNHSSQLAALDYMVSVYSDVFLSTFHGNMARLVEGHRRYLGHKKTILPNRKKLVELFELYENRTLTWRQLSRRVRRVHADLIGAPRPRRVLAGRPKEEDNFFQNPHECICERDKVRALEEIQKREETLHRAASVAAARDDELAAPAGGPPPLALGGGQGSNEGAAKWDATRKESATGVAVGPDSHVGESGEGMKNS